MRDERLACLIQERHVGLIPRVQDFRKHGETLHKLFGSVSVEHSILNFIYGKIRRVRPIEVITANGYNYSCFDLKLKQGNSSELMDLIISTSDGARHRHSTPFDITVEYVVTEALEVENEVIKSIGLNLKFQPSQKKNINQNPSSSIYQTISSYIYQFLGQREDDSYEKHLSEEILKAHHGQQFVGSQVHVDVVNSERLQNLRLVLDDLIQVPLRADSGGFEAKVSKVKLNFYGS